MRNRSGFTVVEIIIVITIMGILMGIGIPNFLSFLPNWRLKSAARDLYSNLQKAKMTAIKTNSSCTITYNPSGTYTISGAMNKVVNLADYGSSVKYDPDPGTAPFSVTSVTFNSRGLISGATGDAYLSTQDATAHYKVGVIMSGLVKLEKL